ncbi:MULTISPECIES: tetratricopeptide repeat protein [unclassified Anabaena]|uniref:tetratricopeptide repeat protein n=1 Tax=unclassified Anabaena TaxID=2619674 RepID=UPI00144677F1|nr:MULTISPECIES: tetratricopeptide repeat protein [unclassified Anabaena]MTJ09820.1 tetratricopeptide repeat protein [Anabaena sp. UHCC 0204]MTJ53355.1 tetratricopeptide repeat protein [Anabaena sp. UHCC 0253]
MEFENLKIHQTALDSLDFTTAGELTISTLEISLTSSQLSTLSAWEFTHWVAIDNWLTDYFPDDNATNLDKVRGYLEAFHHLCELAEWEKAFKILFIDTSYFGGNKVLHEQLFIWGYYQEQVNFYKRLLNKFGLKCDCFLFHGLGKAYDYLGKVEEAIYYYQQQLVIADQVNDDLSKAQAHGGLGRIYEWQLEQYQESIFHYQQQLEISQKINDNKQEASAIFGIATAYLGCLEYHKAIKFATQALSIVQILNDVEMETNILGFIGVVYAQLGLPDKGLNFIEQQLKLSLEQGNKYQECMALSRLGLYYTNLEEYDISLEYYHKALKIIDFCGEPRQKSRLLLNLGFIYSQIKQYSLAIEYLKLALQISILMTGKYQEVYVRINLAYCYICLKQPEGFEHLQIALNIATNLKSSELLGIVFAGLANYYWHQGNYIYGLMLIIKSLWIHPPWKSTNAQTTFKIAMQIIGNSLIFWRKK